MVDPSSIPSDSGQKSTLSKVVGFLLIFAVCFFMGNVVLLLLALASGMPLTEGLDLFSALSDPGMKPYIKAGIGLNHLLIFTGTSLAFAYWLKRESWAHYFDQAPLDWRLAFQFLLLLICAYPLIGASATVFENVEWASQIDETNIEALMKMLKMDNIGDLLVNLIIVALLPAVGEELLFRGILQKELVQKLKNPHIAIFLASFIFSAVHLQIQGFLPKFFIGLILGYAYYWTKSIWYPILLHFFNNGMQTLILFFVGDQIETLEEETIQPEFFQLLIGVVFSCFLCYFIIGNIRNLIRQKQNKII